MFILEGGNFKQGPGEIFDPSRCTTFFSGKNYYRLVKDYLPGIFGLCWPELASSPFICTDEVASVVTGKLLFLGGFDVCLASNVRNGKSTGDSAVNWFRHGSLFGSGIPTGGIPGGYDKLSMLSWKDNGGSIGGRSRRVESDVTTSYRDDWHWHNSPWHY